MFHFLELCEFLLYLPTPHGLHAAELLVAGGLAEIRVFQVSDVLHDLHEGGSLRIVSLPAFYTHTQTRRSIIATQKC
jgi:hypothetical protein